jgi:hypothetical protein
VFSQFLEHIHVIESQVNSFILRWNSFCFLITSTSSLPCFETEFNWTLLLNVSADQIRYQGCADV